MYPVDDSRWDGLGVGMKGLLIESPGFEKPEVQNWNKQENSGRKVLKGAK